MNDSEQTEGEHLAALARSELFPFRLLITFAATFPARGDSFWLAVARQPRSSTQKFIVEAASEKKARHLACFDDSDASDDSVQGGVEQLNHPRGPHFPIAHCGAIVYHFISYLAHAEVELYE